MHGEGGFRNAASDDLRVRKAILAALLQNPQYPILGLRGTVLTRRVEFGPDRHRCSGEVTPPPVEKLTFLRYSGLKAFP